MNRAVAKRLGTRARWSAPDVTWCRLPDKMLKLLIQISESERSRMPEKARVDPARSAQSEGVGNYSTEPVGVSELVLATGATFSDGGSSAGVTCAVSAEPAAGTLSF